MRDQVRALRILIETAFQADRRRALCVFVLSPIVGLTSVLYGFGMKWLVDGASHQQAADLLVAAGLLAATVTITHVLGTTTANLRLSLQQRVGLLLDQRILQMCTQLPTLEHHENPAYLDKLELLRAHRGEIGSAFGALIENLRGLTRFTGVIGALATVDPRLALLPILALPAALAATAAQRVLRRADEQTTEPERARRWLFTLASTAGPAKELRVYGLDGEIAARHHALLEGIHRVRHHAEVRAELWPAAGWAVFGLGFIGAVALVVQRALHGLATPGDVALVISLAGQLDSTVSGTIQLLAWLQQALRAATHYLWLVDYAETAMQTDQPARMPVPSCAGELTLDHVRFSYPGTGTPVLHDVSLTIPAGATVAIVGENGAGKTTLVKLLCRLYEPTAGRILLDGCDLRRFDVAQWRARLAAGFQDFCRLELLTRETVGVGELAKIEDSAAVLAALARAGAADIPGQLPAGLETRLGRTFEDGVDLSVGQWQKLAMGRAMMRQQPILLLLDEPTASLDAETEHALFERYTDVARRINQSTITVFVSHRFSTVRMADWIVVLDRGRVREAGNHDQLMAADDLYATLYRLHARGYQQPAPTINVPNSDQSSVASGAPV